MYNPAELIALIDTYEQTYNAEIPIHERYSKLEVIAKDILMESTRFNFDAEYTTASYLLNDLVSGENEFLSTYINDTAGGGV
jgi:hypothetical protein